MAALQACVVLSSLSQSVCIAGEQRKGSLSFSDAFFIAQLSTCSFRSLLGLDYTLEKNLHKHGLTPGSLQHH